MHGLMLATLTLIGLGFGVQIAITHGTRISEVSPAAVPDRDGAPVPADWLVPYVRRDALGRPTCRRNVLEIGCPFP